MKLDKVLSEAAGGDLIALALGFTAGLMSHKVSAKLAISIPSKKKFDELIKLPPHQRQKLTFSAEDKKSIEETQALVDLLVKKASYKISKTGTGILHKSWELYL